MKDNNDKPFECPINGTLDLHMFAARDTKEVVLEYIDACIKKNIFKLRIVHGKGIGVKRNIVHSILKNHKNVIDYYSEGGSGGGWGATVVNLKQV
ncbi:MAG: Smr/MutS family protein [Candidatus Zixiibacteriota bacterium]